MYREERDRLYRELLRISKYLDLNGVNLRILVDEENLQHLTDYLKSNGLATRLAPVSIVSISQENRLYEDDTIPISDYTQGSLLLDLSLIDRFNLMLRLEQVWSFAKMHLNVVVPAVIKLGRNEFGFLQAKDQKMHLVPYNLTVPVGTDTNLSNFPMLFAEGLGFQELVDKSNHALDLVGNIVAGHEWLSEFKYQGPSIVRNGKLFRSDTEVSDFLEPKSFGEIQKALQFGPVLLSGFGRGTDLAAEQLLRSMDRSRDNEERIFRIEEYSRNNLHEFFNRVMTSQEVFAGTSVILRDFFDPFPLSYDSHSVKVQGVGSVQNLLGGSKSGKRKDIEAIVRKFESSFQAAECPESISFEDYKNLFRNEDFLNSLFDKFDGKTGNYLIFTTSFETGVDLEEFYRQYQLSEKVLLIDNFINKAQPFLLEFDSKQANEWFEKMIRKNILDDVSKESVSEVEQFLIDQFKDVVMSDSPDFRVALASLFFDCLSHSLERLKWNKAIPDTRSAKHLVSDVRGMYTKVHEQLVRFDDLINPPID